MAPDTHIFEYKRKKPTIKAFQIPPRCTLEEANFIEVLFPGVKRKSWNTEANRVDSFTVEGEEASWTQWVVHTDDPFKGDFDQYRVLDNKVFHRLYEPKKK